MENKTAAKVNIITKLQFLLARVNMVHLQAARHLRSQGYRETSRALVAIGLCTQAREQLSSACQTLGISVKVLPEIKDPDSAEAVEELKKARINMVKQVTQKCAVSRESVFMSMNSFAEECAALAHATVNRAEQLLAD
jgi:hypothetical protein